MNADDRKFVAELRAKLNSVHRARSYPALDVGRLLAIIGALQAELGESGKHDGYEPATTVYVDRE